MLLLFFYTSCYTKAMPEQESIQTLEEEIRMLEEKLAARKVAEVKQEAEGSGREEKDIFRDVLHEHVESAKEIAEKQTATGSADSADMPAAPPFNYAAGAQQKADDIREKQHHEQVEALVEIALTKGILEAVHVARHLNNPHLLDDFHDMLVDEYYEKLVQARKLS